MRSRLTLGQIRPWFGHIGGILWCIDGRSRPSAREIFGLRQRLPHRPLPTSSAAATNRKVRLRRCAMQQRRWIRCSLKTTMIVKRVKSPI